MKVFIIGGNGFIGSNVVRTLVREGHSVRCLLRATSNCDRLSGVTYERHQGDITDAASVAEGLSGCDAVIHLASPSAWSAINSPALDKVVIQGTKNVLEAAKASGNPDMRVVFCSSILAVNNADAPTVFDESTPFEITDEKLRYSHAKHQAEEMCKQAADDGLHTVIVNPSEVYGPNDTQMITAGNLVDFAKSNPVMVCHGGTAVAHVEDVALGVVRAMERGKSGERYILGGDNLSVRELAELCLKLLNTKRKVVTIPTGLLKGITKVATGLRIPLPYEPATIPYATRYWFMDNSKATRELGVEFRSAERTLAPTLAWLQSAGHI